MKLKTKIMKAGLNFIMAAGMLSLMAIASVNAQRGHGPKWGHGPGYGPGFGPDSCRIQLMVDDMAKELSLTEVQQKLILEAHYAHMEEVKSFRLEYKNDCVGAREARLASREKLDNAIKDILTEEQFIEFTKLMAERRGPHGPRYKRRD